MYDDQLVISLKAAVDLLVRLGWIDAVHLDIVQVVAGGRHGAGRVHSRRRNGLRIVSGGKRHEGEHGAKRERAATPVLCLNLARSLDYIV